MYIMWIESAGLGNRFDMGNKDYSWISGFHHSIREKTLNKEQIKMVGFGDHEYFVKLVEL